MAKTQRILDRAAILAAKDLKTTLVTVPEWGGAVLVRTMSAAERLAYEEAIKDGDNLSPVAAFVAATVVDAKGERLFSPEDVEALKTKSFKALLRVFEVASKINALTAADVKDLEKN